MSARKLLRHPVVHLSGVIILLSALIIAASLLFSSSKNASATVTSCSASVSPNSISGGSTVDLVFNVNNTDSVEYNWIKITSPSSDFSINQAVSSGWNASTNSDDTTLTGGTLSVSNNLNITVGVSAADTEAGSASWTVQVSDDNGSSTFACSGSLGVAITAEDSAPEISNITVSDITSSSVKITWDTSESANSLVNYGSTDSYGSSKSDTASTTSHTINIDSLSANTTYHFEVKSTDSGDNTATSGDATFTTAKAGLTSDPITITTSTTTTVTATPTPTPIPDRIPPAVSITTDLAKPFLKPPTITGKTSDASGIFRVQYSVDDGKNWNNVDEIPNLGANFVTFTFTPPPLDDDNYNIRIKAIDNAPAKNERISEPYILIIDRLPPGIGGNIISIGPQVLFPNEQGYLLTSSNVLQKITLSAVGGPTSITLLTYEEGAASESAQTYKLIKNVDNGLWSEEVRFDKPGIYQLLGESIDGAGNKTTRLLNKIAVLEQGAIIRSEGSNKAGETFDDVTVTLYYFEEKYQIWRVWDAEAYKQKNPVKTNNKGEFSYLVPSGKYYFDIKGGGLAHTQSEIFTIDKPTVLNPIFTVKPLKILLDLWLFKIYWPDFSTSTVPVEIIVPTFVNTKNELIGKVASELSLPTTDGGQFILSNTRGTALILSFLTSWSPQASEQISAIDKLTGTPTRAIPLMLGDTMSKITIFKKKGEYRTNIVVDSDRKSVDPYHINTIPTHYFLDRRGVIKKIVPGVLSDKELEDILLEVQ